jgi:hypothetical protein
MKENTSSADDTDVHSVLEHKGCPVTRQAGTEGR